MILASRRHIRDEDGFSLVELMVVVLLMSAIMLILYSSTESFLRINEVTQGKSYSLASARTALEQAAKQIRAANPIKIQSPVSSYDNRITFDVYCSQAGVGACNSLNQRPVAFQLTGNSLIQVIGTGTSPVVGPDGPAAVPIAQRQGAVVNGGSRPIFRYFDRHGVQINTSGGSAAPATKFRDCTRRVRIDLVVISEHRRPNSTIQLTTDVDLRNFNRVSTC